MRTIAYTRAYVRTLPSPLEDGHWCVGNVGVRPQGLLVPALLGVVRMAHRTAGGGSPISEMDRPVCSLHGSLTDSLRLARSRNRGTAKVEFHALAPETFAAFDEPSWAKIVWTLGADPLGPAASVFRTETRVATTDAASRVRFRRYWAVFSPGILLIRREALRLVKGEAERRVRGTSGGGAP